MPLSLDKRPGQLARGVCPLPYGTRTAVGIGRDHWKVMVTRPSPLRTPVWKVVPAGPKPLPPPPPAPALETEAAEAAAAAPAEQPAAAAAARAAATPLPARRHRHCRPR